VVASRKGENCEAAVKESKRSEARRRGGCHVGSTNQIDALVAADIPG